MEAAGRVRRCHQGRAIDETNSSVMCWVTVWGGIQMLTWQQVNTSEVAGYDSSDFYGQWNEFTATRQMRLTRVSGNGTALSRLWWTLVSAFYDWWSAVNPPCVYVLGGVCACMCVCACERTDLVSISRPLGEQSPVLIREELQYGGCG